MWIILTDIRQINNITDILMACWAKVVFVKYQANT